MRNFSSPPFKYLYNKYQRSRAVKKYRLTFNEFAFLHKLHQGIKSSHIYQHLFVSHATISRVRQSLVQKLSSNTFEQALILIGQLDLLNDE